MSASETIHCKNCEAMFQGKYCNYCGQAAATSSITWFELLKPLPKAILHVNGGFFYTLKQLITRPGDSIKDYLTGKRVAYYNPFLTLVIVAGFCSFLYAQYHLETILASVRLDEIEKQNSFLAHKYFAIRTLFFVMLCSVGDYVLFQKNGFTFPEMLIANMFGFCGVFTIQIGLFPILMVSHGSGAQIVIEGLAIFSAFLYMLIIRIHLFEASGNWNKLFRIVISVCCYFIIAYYFAKVVVKPWFMANMH